MAAHAMMVEQEAVLTSHMLEVERDRQTVKLEVAGPDPTAALDWLVRHLRAVEQRAADIRNRARTAEASAKA